MFHFGSLLRVGSKFIKPNLINSIRVNGRNCTSSSTTATMSSNKKVITERRDQLFLIGINRPEKRNCVDTETANLLVNAFEEFENDDSLCVAILHGNGGNFCAGMDLSEVSSIENLPSEEVFKLLITNKKRPMGPTQKVFCKPTIAAVSGFAVAGGLELALLCDLRVVEETAIMGVFCRRFGVPLIDGGTVRLPKIVGLGRALDLILTGRGVTGQEAFQIGLANRLVACGSALGQAISLATSLLKFPQECMNADKRSAYYSTFDAKSIEDALEYEWEYSKDIIYKEAVQGASKFVSGIGRHGKFNLDAKDPVSKL